MKNLYFLSCFLLSSFIGLSQSNQYILNIHISDKTGSPVSGKYVVIIKENNIVKIQTGNDGVARDTSLLKPGYTATYTVSIEDPCLNAPYTTIVKTYPGIEDIKYTLCNKTIADLCKVSFKAFSADAKNTTFTFLAEPQDPNNKYSWDFGDGTNAEGSKVQHTYLKSGVYVVTVKMVTANGCVAVYSEKLTIGSTTTTPNPSTLSCTCCATMDISLAPDTKDVYVFKAKAGFANALFSWQINGQIISGNETKYKFEKGGSYVIQLQAKSDECDVKIKKSLIVQAPTTGGGNTDPNDCKIDFSYAYISSASSEVKFKPLLTDPTISTQYFWSFGDGTSSSEMSPVHKYSKSGTYSVTLVIYFSKTKKCTITKDISVTTVIGGNENSGTSMIISKEYPNPSKNSSVPVDINTIETAKAEIQLYNQANLLISNIPVQLSSGENTIFLDFESIPNGLYFLTLNHNGTLTSKEKLIINK